MEQQIKKICTRCDNEPATWKLAANKFFWNYLCVVCGEVAWEIFKKEGWDFKELYEEIGEE